MIDLAEQVLGNPVAFIDTAQNETTLSAHYPEEDMEDKAYRRQQISDEEYQKNTDYVTALSRHRESAVLVWAAYPPQTPDLRLSGLWPACRRNPAAGCRESLGRSGHGFSPENRQP